MSKQRLNRLAVWLAGLGLILVAVGTQLPYALLPSGPVVRDATTAALLAVVLLAAFAGARGRWRAPAVLVGAATFVGAAYLGAAALRAVPTWAAVYHGQDATAGPAVPIVALGHGLLFVALLVRATASRGGHPQASMAVQ